MPFVPYTAAPTHLGAFRGDPPIIPAASFGVPLLPNELSGARLVIMMAFGANLTQPSSSWAWIDVSVDAVQSADGAMANMTVAKPDESAQSLTATCGIVFKNQTAKYSSFNPLSPNWPYVQGGTPLWIQVYVAGNFYTRFFGEIVGFQSGWDTTGNYAISTVTANGILRRVSGGTSVLRSAMARGIGAQSISASHILPLRYWTFEDAAGSGQVAEYYGGPSLTPASTVTFAAMSGLPGSDALPTFPSGASVSAKIPAYADTQEWRIEFAMSLPATPSASAVMLSWTTTGGSGNKWQYRYDQPSNSIFLECRNTAGTELLSDLGIASVVLGELLFFVISVKASGGTTYWKHQYTRASGATSSVTDSAVVTLGSLSSGTIVHWATGGTDQTGFGHLVVFNSVDTFSIFLGTGLFSSWDNFYVNAWDSENPITRMTRLCGEENIAFAVTDNAPTDYPLGPQGIDTLVGILRECELTDGGTLWDGMTQGLLYQRIGGRYNQTPALALDASAGDLTPPFAPQDDDFGKFNRVRVDRKNGSSAIFTDPTGALGTAIFESSLPGSVNPVDDSRLGFRASWEVHKGITKGLRYPNININWRTLPAKILDFLNCKPGSIISIVPPYPAQHPSGTLIQAIEGWQELIGPLRWETTLNLSRGQVYDVLQIGDSLRGRVETGGASLAADVAVGATNFPVVSAGALWTRNSVFPADFPFSVEISGIQISVTGVAGTSSPQTFSCNSDQIVKPLHSGDNVKLWHPGVVKL